MPPAFRWNDRTGAELLDNAQAAPPGGYDAELDRLAADWRDHLSRTPD